MIIPSLEDFKRMASHGNLIPVFEEIHYDLQNVPGSPSSTLAAS